MPINPQDLGRLLKPNDRAWSNLHGAILRHTNGWILRVVEVRFRPPYCSLISQVMVPLQQRVSARLGCRRRRPMTKRQDRDAIYVKRQFDTEIIVLCVR